MENHTSQEPISGWNFGEEVGINDFDFDFIHDSTIDFQENLQPQAQSDNQLNNLPTQDIQAQEPLTHFEAGTNPYNQFYGTEFLTAPNRTSPVYVTDAAASYSANSYPGFGTAAINSEMTPSHASLQAPLKRTYDNFADQGFLLEGSSFGSHQNSIGGVFALDQSQLSHSPATVFGVEDLQHAPMILSGFPQFHNIQQTSIQTDPQLKDVSFSQLDLSQSLSSSCSPFNISTTAPFGFDYNLNAGPHLGNVLITETSTQPIHELGTAENPIEITETIENAPHSQFPSDINGTESLPPLVSGPSRPVTLPPARRGGRKGPRSALELKNLRAARKQGVCIRCRQTKEKCHGGFPCKRCRENTGAIFWRFPCTKAEFLGLLEHGSYFEDVEVFQASIVEKIGLESFSQYYTMVSAMVTLGHSSSDVTVNILEVQSLVTLCWHKSLNIFADIWETRLQSNALAPSRQLMEKPYKLAQTDILQAPITTDGIYLSKTRIEQLVVMLHICVSKFTVAEITACNDQLTKLAQEYGKTIAELFEGTIKLCLWISRRYYEVMVFRILQDASNRLTSFTSRELLELADALLDVLETGSAEICKPEDRLLYQINNSPYERNRAYDSRKKDIRQALFIYFSITLDKLPAWHDFWSLERNGIKRWFPGVSVPRFTDLETFDWYTRCELKRAKIHLNLLPKRQTDSENIQQSSNQAQYDSDTTRVDLELRLGTLDEIVHGPRNVEADLTAILKLFSELYQPTIEELDRFFSRLEGSIPEKAPGSIAQAVKDLVSISKYIRQRLEDQLTKSLLSEEPTDRFYSIGHDIKEALEFMVCVDTICSDLCAIIEGMKNEREHA